MIFIIVGMGGGIGIGVVLIVVGIVRELGVLIVGVVICLFIFEGFKCGCFVVEGIVCLKENVDILLIILNNCLLEVVDKKILMFEVFCEVDNVLC